MQLLEHFKELSIYPKNAKELKGLILQLAVQGKLTADWRLRHPELVSGSHSAKALLASIKAEKEQLIKDKKIKKEKALPVIAENELPFDLPEGWEWCRMQDYLDVRDGTHDTPKYVSNGVPLVTSKNLYTKKLDLTNVKYISLEDHLEISKRSLVERDNILFAMIGSIGNPVIVDIEPNFSIKNVALIKYYKKELSVPMYILHFLEFATKEFISNSDGAVQSFVSLTKLRSKELPLPPLAEQKAIVEIVNTLFKEVEALEKLTLERISLKEDFITSALRELSTGDTPKEWAYLQKHFPAFMNEERNIKKLRETILQLAVQGKLTANWRTCHPELAEGSHSAKALLASIKAEKEQLIKNKKIKKEKPLSAIAEDEIPYELPEGWEWCRFGDLVTFLNGYAFKSSTYVPSSKYQVIRLGNVKNDNFLIDTKEAYVPKTVGEDAIAYQLSTSDILTTLTGTKDKRDYCYTCLVKPEHLENRVLLLNQRVGCIRAIDKGASELLNKFLKADAILDQLFATETGTANQGNIGSTAFKNLVFPLPPLAEQKAIVEKVNSLMALCNELETAVVASKANAEMLMQSVLREVFETKAESVDPDHSEVVLTAAEA